MGRRPGKNWGGRHRRPDFRIKEPSGVTGCGWKDPKPQTSPGVGNHGSEDRTPEPLTESVWRATGGLHPARMFGSRDCVGREASAHDSNQLFRLLRAIEDAPVFG